MDSAELLEQLADIHLPEPVSFWPPAPGWWLLALLAIVLLVWLMMKALAAQRQRQICAFAIDELNQVYKRFQSHQSDDPEQLNQARLLFLNDFNAVLRRVALWHFPHDNIASLGGRAWVDFIREKGESSLLTDEIAEALEEGRFKTRIEVDAERIQQFGERWITSLYMNRSGADKAPNLSA